MTPNLTKYTRSVTLLVAKERRGSSPAEPESRGSASLTAACVTITVDKVMELDTVRETANVLHNTESDSSNKAQVLRTAVAEIGSIQEQEQHFLQQECSEVCFYRFVGSQGFAPVLQLSPSMRKTRDIGKQLLKRDLFPLFSTYGRELWTYVQFLFVLGFVLKCAVIDIAISNPNKRTTVDFVSLTCSLVFLPLSILDTCMTIYIHKCNLVRAPCRHQIHRHDVTSRVADETTKLLSNNHGGCCGSFCSLFTSSYCDLIRMILNEIIVYSATICAMFQLILRAKQNGIGLQMGFSIASFIIAVLWKISTVYGVCIFVVLRILFAIRKIRKDGPVAGTANWFHIHLFVHVLGQMVSQVAMIVCIGIKMNYENRNFSIDSKVHVTGFLWYMLFSALIIPLTGVFTFAISNFYSVQEYPIGYFLDLLHSFMRRDKQNAQEVEQPIESGMSLESIVQNIETEFTKIHSRSILRKYGYVFLSPLLVTLSIVHTLLIFAFLGSYLLEFDLMTSQFSVLYGSTIGWTVFCVIAGLLISVPHILVLLVGVIWITIIVTVLLIVACCICSTISSNSSGDCANCDCPKTRQSNE